jgi:putative heme-binding domain-containing protein
MVDEDGIALLREWIASLEPKPADGGVEELRREIASGGTEALVAKHVGNTSSALLLAHALAGPRVSTDVKERVAMAATKSSNQLMVELFERFLPASARSNVVLTMASREEILALRGDVRRGASLLKDPAKVSCLQCHQFQNGGRAFGPSFVDAARKKTREQVLDGVMNPSREVAPEYVLYSVELAEDELLSGIIVKRGKDEIVVRDATGTDHAIAASKVKSTRAQQLSAMPEGLLAGLSAQEAADLVEAIIAEGAE